MCFTWHKIFVSSTFLNNLIFLQLLSIAAVLAAEPKKHEKRQILSSYGLNSGLSLGSAALGTSLPYSDFSSYGLGRLSSYDLGLSGL